MRVIEIRVGVVIAFAPLVGRLPEGVTDFAGRVIARRRGQVGRRVERGLSGR